MERRYGEHRAAVQRREQEVKRKEATARRHEEDARRKNEEATRRMREAERYEQQVRALEVRARKEVELVQKGPVAARARTQSVSAAPRLARSFSKEAWQHKQRPGTDIRVRN